MEKAKKNQVLEILESVRFVLFFIPTFSLFACSTHLSLQISHTIIRNLKKAVKKKISIPYAYGNWKVRRDGMPGIGKKGIKWGR